jgi:septum formation protein
VSDRPATRLILASTSPYRRALLARLQLPFECVAPLVDECRLGDEPADQMVMRLARLKAESVARRHPGCIVIGSDQAALRGAEVLGKPGSVERCHDQLRQSSARTVAFLTAVYLIDGVRVRVDSHLDRTLVSFRALDDAEIARYVAADQPLDCAGGFKGESLGIALFQRIETADPTALTGLPLIWLCDALRRASIPVP